MLNNVTKSFFGKVNKADDNESAENHPNETEIIKEKLRIIKTEIEALSNQLVAYQEKEQLVSHILISAQLDAFRIEQEARQNARLIIDECCLDLTERKKELDKLRSTVTELRKQYREILRHGPAVSAHPDTARDS